MTVIGGAEAQRQKEVECKHQGYRMREGELVCDSCGAPSPSRKWRSNVFGAAAVAALVEAPAPPAPDPQVKRGRARGG